jgi:hypothetical protein
VAGSRYRTRASYGILKDQAPEVGNPFPFGRGISVGTSETEHSVAEFLFPLVPRLAACALLTTTRTKLDLHRLLANRARACNQRSVIRIQPARADRGYSKKP